MLPLVVQGFHHGVQQVTLPDGRPVVTGETNAYNTMHSNRVVLIDRDGHIRAYYDGLAVDLDRLLVDVRYLVR